MIQIYAGVPGSGKSCHVAKDICGWLKHKQYVIANFDFVVDDDWAEYFVRIPEYPSMADIQRAVSSCPRLRREHNAILVIDEAQRIWNSRSWSAKGRDDVIKFMTLSRHLGVDVVMIAQAPEMLDKQIRDCAQTVVKHMRVAAMGAVPFVISLFGMIPLCFWAESYYGSKIKVASGFFLPRKKWWDRYDSYSVDFIGELSPGND